MSSSSSSFQSQIQVSVRIKPFIPVLSSQPPIPKSSLKKDKKNNTTRPKTTGSTITNHDSCEDWITDNCQNFASHVWSTTHSQSMVYHDFMEEQFLPAFEQGLNCTCFLYGQTGSGTYA